MKPQKIRDLSPSELADQIATKSEELANLKFQLSLHQLDNATQIRTVRRELARLKTIYREHTLKIRTLLGEEAVIAEEVS